jgi:hypothetical protein
MKNIPASSTQVEALNRLLIAAVINPLGKVLDKDGLTQTVAELLDQGANVNAASSAGASALILAAQLGHTETVSALLAHKEEIDVNAETSIGFTALMFAAQNGHKEIVLAFLSRDDVNWQMVQDQLSRPALQNLNEEVSVLLAVALPGGEPRNSIIASFNQRNPDNVIQPQNNDIIGAGPAAYKELKNIVSCHVEYLIHSGVPENQAKNLGKQKFFDLLNNPEKRQEALARNNLVSELVAKSESLGVDYAIDKLGRAIPEDKAALEDLDRLSQEELYKLTKKIIDNSKEAEGKKVEGNDDTPGIPKLQAMSFVTALASNSTALDPQNRTSPATAISDPTSIEQLTTLPDQKGR